MRSEVVRVMVNAAMWLRSRIPVAVLPALIAVRFWIAWSRESVRAKARAEMAFLLEESTPGADVEAAARAYVRRQLWRGEMRWHLDQLTRLRVVGLEHLRGAQALDRGVVLNFMHHGYFEGALASLGALGVPIQMIVYPWGLRPEAPFWIKQHIKAASAGGATPVSTEVGTQGIIELLRSGEVVAIASDVPGRTPTRFAGRDVLGSFGAARISFDTGSPVVLMTSEQDEQGPFVRLSEPLLPQDYPDAHALLHDMLRRHESVVLRWPEDTDIPTARWKLLEAVAEAT